MTEIKAVRKKPAVNGKETLHIENNFHSYPEPQGGSKRVLTNVDLILDSGEFACLVGPSGCGKSTLLRLITGQERIQQAKHFDVFGRPVGFPDKSRGVVFQQYTLLPNLSVLNNVRLGLEFQANLHDLWRPKWRKEARDISMKYIERMRLTDAANKYPQELSGGMRQRVAIAQTLVTIEMFGMPKLLCMDEPFGALDPGTREDMQVLLLQLWEEYKMTVIFVTHDLEEAAFLSSRLLVLSQFWKSDKDNGEKAAGARIVMDIPLEKKAMSTEVKKTAEFGALIAHVLDVGFNPKHRRHVAEFNADLRHPRSFQSLSIEEDHTNGVFHDDKVA
jgi:NitT/TauT family transport system ATP-binding protein